MVVQLMLGRGYVLSSIVIHHRVEIIVSREHVDLRQKVIVPSSSKRQKVRTKRQKIRRSEEKRGREKKN